MIATSASATGTPAESDTTPRTVPSWARNGAPDANRPMARSSGDTRRMETKSTDRVAGMPRKSAPPAHRFVPTPASCVTGGDMNPRTPVWVGVAASGALALHERRGRNAMERFAAAVLETLMNAIEANDEETGMHV